MPRAKKKEAVSTQYVVPCTQHAINNSILSRFTKLDRDNRLAHAYLFIGSKGIGKFETAIAITKFFNCENPGEESDTTHCGQCPPCLKIASGNHPDVSVIDKEDGQTIKISKIRDLISRSQLRPFEAKRKIYIIRDIENLSLEGGNALLKTLEEPARDSLLILTTSVPERNLNTIRSRCHAVHFFPLSRGKLATMLEEEIKSDKDVSHFISFFSQGCLTRAHELINTQTFVRKNEIIDNFVFERNNERYTNFSKELLTDKTQTKQALEILYSWFRDLMLMKAGVQQNHIMNKDRSQDLEKLDKEYSFQQIGDIIWEIVNTIKVLGENLNVKIPMNILREKIWVKF